jgi:hypothetical protein
MNCKMLQKGEGNAMEMCAGQHCGTTIAGHLQHFHCQLLIIKNGLIDGQIKSNSAIHSAD